MISESFFFVMANLLFRNVFRHLRGAILYHVDGEPVSVSSPTASPSKPAADIQEKLDMKRIKTDVATETSCDVMFSDVTSPSLYTAVIRSCLT